MADSSFFASSSGGTNHESEGLSCWHYMARDDEGIVTGFVGGVFATDKSTIGKPAPEHQIPNFPPPVPSPFCAAGQDALNPGETIPGPSSIDLFIFHIPDHFTNLDLYHLFCPYGYVLSARIVVDKKTGRNRGFGFVSFGSPKSAAVAIKALNGFPIANKRLKVQYKHSRRPDRCEPLKEGFLSVTDGHQTSSFEEQVPQVVESHGLIGDVGSVGKNDVGALKVSTPSLKSSSDHDDDSLSPSFDEILNNLLDEINNTSINDLQQSRAGAPSVDYEAIDQISGYIPNPPMIANGISPNNEVQYIHDAPLHAPVHKASPSGVDLFIFHIPDNFTNRDLYNLFCPYGTVVSARIVVEQVTRRNRGFGFVTYDSRESAEKAIKALNGFPVANKRLKVEHKKKTRNASNFFSPTSTNGFINPQDCERYYS